MPCALLAGMLVRLNAAVDMGDSCGQGLALIMRSGRELMHVPVYPAVAPAACFHPGFRAAAGTKPWHVMIRLEQQTLGIAIDKKGPFS